MAGLWAISGLAEFLINLRFHPSKMISYNNVFNQNAWHNIIWAQKRCLHIFLTNPCLCVQCIHYLYECFIAVMPRKQWTCLHNASFRRATGVSRWVVTSYPRHYSAQHHGLVLNNQVRIVVLLTSMASSSSSSSGLLCMLQPQISIKLRIRRRAFRPVKFSLSFVRGWCLT